MLQNNYRCPVTETMSVIGSKWKPIILWIIHDQTRQFGEIQRFIPKITHKVLTQQLRELERDGIVNRRVYPIVPPKVEYSLTEYGSTIIPILKEMEKWGTTHITESDKHPNKLARTDMSAEQLN